eukprot:scaffold161007_cov32-Prasinocladus_malaysianus.AAC.2
MSALVTESTHMDQHHWQTCCGKMAPSGSVPWPTICGDPQSLVNPSIRPKGRHREVWSRGGN